MTPDQQSRLLMLFAACSHETLSEAEQQELQAVLQADAEVRRLWFLHQDLELGLKCLTQVPWGTSDDSSDVVRLSKRSQKAENGPGTHLPTSGADRPPMTSLARRYRAMTAVMVLCLTAMVMFGLYGVRRPADLSQAVGNQIANNRVDDLIVESPTNGTTLRLSEQKGHVIALHFLLKTECPFCLKLVHDYAQLATSNPHVLHLFLKPDSPDEIKVWAAKINQEGLKNPPVIYRDPDARLAKKFAIPDGYQFHGQTTNYPALVLLDGSGQELFRYVGQNNTDRMRPDDFVTRLAMATDHK